MWIVTRCTLVSINQITLLIVYVLKPASYTWMAFLMSNSKLHTITIVAMLNSRKLSNESEPAVMASLSLTSNFERRGRSFGSAVAVDGSHNVKAPDLEHMAELEDREVLNMRASQEEIV